MQTSCMSDMPALPFPSTGCMVNETALDTVQTMRQPWQLEDDHVSVSGYYLPDAAAQSAVDRAVAAYDPNGLEGLADTITPDLPTGERDGFAFVPDRYGVVGAHGADPYIVGIKSNPAFRKE